MELALIAEFEVAAKDRERFLAAAKQELDAVRDDEPGCLRFDIIVFDEGACRGAFVEAYADQAAADLHPELPHFKAFFDAIEDIDVQWRLRRGETMS